MRIVLASRSPRRREILETLGVPFTVVSADADETCGLTDPAALVTELALRKGRATRELLKKSGQWDEKTVVIAADTVVAAGGRILGKPKDDADAAAMLRLLSGTTHHVVSGVALLTGDREAADHDSTAVRFDAMTEAEIARYVESGEPRDKAGAYAIQGHASPYIRGIDGDYFNVVGLPVHCLDALCRRFAGCSLLELNEKEGL